MRMMLRIGIATLLLAGCSKRVDDECVVYRNCCGYASACTTPDQVEELEAAEPDPCGLCPEGDTALPDSCVYDDSTATCDWR